MALPDESRWANEIYGTQFASLMRFLLARLRRRQDAEDLAQEAFLRLLRVPNADLIRQPDAYLFRIAWNLLSEYRLRSHRTAVVFDSEQAEKAGDVARGATPTEVMIDSEHLTWALEQLPAKCRLALILHRRDGFTYAQIGQQLGVSPDMVKKYIATGVARCRMAFGVDVEKQGGDR